MTRISAERFNAEDLFFYYDMDDVKLRWDHAAEAAFQKFRGEEEFQCNGWSYFNQAMNEGVEITREEYYAG